MTTTSWKSGINGDWNTAANWTAGVPAAGIGALITAKGTYTVTSDGLNSTGTLDMAKGATLDVTGLQLTIASGTGTGALAGNIAVSNAILALGGGSQSTTFDNTGTIRLASASFIGIADDVELSGKGKVDLSGGTIASNGNPAGLLNDDTLFGIGTIGDSNLTLANATKGVIDADSGTGPIVGALTLAAAQVNNLGLLEATGIGILELENEIMNTPKAKIETKGSGTAIRLDGATVENGVITIGKDSTLSSADGSALAPTKPIKNGGLIDATEGSLRIVAAVKNSKTATITADNNTSVELQGAVTGGAAVINGSGAIDFEGPSSAAVNFATGSTGALVLGDAPQFTGSVAGMSGNSSVSIILENIPFADNPVVSPLSSKGILTVTDPVTHVVDSIKIVGTGSFTASAGPLGTTAISDPPAGSPSAPGNSAQLLAQSMASFGTASSATAPRNGDLVDHRRSSDFLAPNAHPHG